MVQVEFFEGFKELAFLKVFWNQSVHYYTGSIGKLLKESHIFWFGGEEVREGTGGKT